jgi:hypothetical protein
MPTMNTHPDGSYWPTPGVKHDSGKPPMELLDRKALEEVAKVLAFGAKKYKADNWRGGISYRRLIGATLRHVTTIMDGEDDDPETGLKGAAHAICELMFLLNFQLSGRVDLDDRYKPNEKA